MPAPKPATEKLEQMLDAHTKKMIRLRAARQRARDAFEDIDAKVKEQEALVTSLTVSLKAIQSISVVRKAAEAEEVTP